ncbi:geranylgeranyl pyrophosphate synthetase [Stygiomarasmius scandens]|uniref:(2E,6E)-farnesyl diphosphate synthase n=1 Tax=Marasmiellus scandens TaxID=2682957 RepID=A0ABR1JID4_9AGAR
MSWSIPNFFQLDFGMVSLTGILASLPGLSSNDKVSPLYEKDIKQSDQRKLLEPFEYYRQLGGKGRRELLLNSLNYHLQLPQRWVSGVASIIEDLHNASLLLDDIEDGSVLRRGSVSAHVKYGIPLTINSANYVFFIAMTKINALAVEFGASTDYMVSIFCEEMLELHRGQGLELWWRQNAVCPTVDEYLLMAERIFNAETGALLRMSARLLMSHPFVRADQTLVDIIVNIGLLYQIRDDYINLTSINFQDKKGFAEDLTEGKFSFPIIHSLEHENDSGLLEIIRQRPEDVEIKKQAIEIIRRTGSLKYTHECLRKREDQLKDAIIAIGGSPGLEKFVAQLSVDNVVVE